MKKVLLILQLVMSTVLYAQKKTDITDGYIIWETEDFKKYTPIIKCSLKISGLILTSQMTDDGIGFVLTENRKYKYVIVIDEFFGIEIIDDDTLAFDGEGGWFVYKRK